MLNFRTITAVISLTHSVFLGADAETKSSELLDLVPKREVLYVGGSYQNVTAGFSVPMLPANLTTEIGLDDERYVDSDGRANLR